MLKAVKRVENSLEPVPSTKLLTAGQVMELLGVSRTGLYYLMRQQGLPYIKFGTTRGAALRFKAKSVEQWVARNERHAAS